MAQDAGRATQVAWFSCTHLKGLTQSGSRPQRGPARRHRHRKHHRIILVVFSRGASTLPPSVVPVLYEGVSAARMRAAYLSVVGGGRLHGSRGGVLPWAYRQRGTLRVGGMVVNSESAVDADVNL
jgi:hypothetical protein